MVDVLQKVYDQQQEMHTHRRRSVKQRIVSVSQPHIRPIVRGKLSANVKFGARLAADDRANIRLVQDDNTVGTTMSADWHTCPAVARIHA
jgi:hypothetical protein